MASEQGKSSGGIAMVVIAVALVAFVLGFFVGSKNVDPAGNAPMAAVGSANSPGAGGVAAGLDGSKIPLLDSPVRGNVNAPITIVDFSSLQCPFCARGNDTLKQLVEKYPNDVRIVSKNFPLGFQAQSPAAAKAAMAAGEQGKYWEMKDHLFKNMSQFRSADMTDLTAGYAKELGLDVEKFKADLKKPEYDAIIKRDQDLGASLGVQGTPHYFVNGERVSGAQPVEAFEAIVKRQLGEAKTMLAAGVSRDALYNEMVAKNFKAEPSAAAADAPAPAPATEVHMVPVRPTDAVKGDKDDYLVTIMEFSSFQCPFCARGAETLRELAVKYPKNVRFVYKHFPLSFQAQSEPAGRAAVAAGEQGKFWEMYDQIYENQRNLAKAGIFEEMATKVGLNIEKFKKDMDSPQAAERVKTNQADGSAAGVSGTPAFLVNGIKLVGAKPASDFIVEIDKQLEIAAKIKKEKNLKGDALYAAVVEHNKANAPKAAAAPAAPPAPAAKVDAKDLVIGKSHVQGPANAPITIYEFSSFQCPFCARGAETLRQVVKEYPGKIKIVYKNFPLAFQAQAEPAGRAALAAGRQNKFWEYYDLIYANQGKLREDGTFVAWAKELGLNIEKFEKDMADPAIAEQVKSEQAEGSKIGVQGTPAFFINGTRLVGAQPIDKFKEVIDAELAKK